MNYDQDNPLRRKKNLKWFHSRIEDFNNEVPYHINQLLTFKNNIQKQYRLENFTAVRQERVSAEKTIRKLKQLLIDIKNLKELVEDCDHEKFEKLVSRSCEKINVALRSFNEFYENLSLKQRNTKYLTNGFQDATISTDENDENRQKQILLHMEEDRWELENRIQMAEAVEKIERDSQIVNEIFHDLHKIVQVQQDTINNIEDNVETTYSEVKAAERELAQVASKVKGGLYPLVGALLGSCVGGPVGFVAGLKIGAAVAVTGSVLGFSGGKIMKIKEQQELKKISEDLRRQQGTKQVG